MDHNFLGFFIYRIYDAVIPDAYPIELLGADQLYGMTRKWVLPQNLDLL